MVGSAQSHSFLTQPCLYDIAGPKSKFSTVSLGLRRDFSVTNMIISMHKMESCSSDGIE